MKNEIVSPSDCAISQEQAVAFLTQEPNCSLCRFFRRFTEDKTRLVGICRRLPPIVLLDKDGDPLSVWPMVDDANFCGEFVGAM